MFLDGDFGTKLRVDVIGGRNARLKGVSACGVAYGGKDILKLKISDTYENNYYARRDLINAVDSLAYED